MNTAITWTQISQTILGAGRALTQLELGHMLGIGPQHRNRLRELAQQLHAMVAAGVLTEAFEEGGPVLYAPSAVQIVRLCDDDRALLAEILEQVKEAAKAALCLEAKQVIG